MTRLTWTFSPEESFVVDGDLAGATFESQIAGHMATLHMPTVAPGSIDSSIPAPDDLVIPFLAAPVTPCPEPDFSPWGSIESRSGSVATEIRIEAVGFTVELPESFDAHEYAAEMDSTFDEWWAVLCGWLEIVTGQVITPVGARRVFHIGNRFRVWSVAGDGAAEQLRYPSNREWPSMLNAPPVTAEVLRSATNLAGSRTSVAFPWTLIRDARALLETGQFRRAVADAGIAAEVATKKLLGVALAGYQLPTGVADRLLKRDRTLGAATGLLSDTAFVSLPEDVMGRLVQTRNRAVHVPASGPPARISEAECIDAIAVAADIVELAYPLPDPLRRLW